MILYQDPVRRGGREPPPRAWTQALMWPQVRLEPHRDRPRTVVVSERWYHARVMDSMSSNRPARWARWLGAAALGSMLALGCDADDEPAVVGGDLRSEELAARCDYLVRCGFMPDEDACLASEGFDAGLVQAVGGETFGRVSYDQEAAAAWLQLLRDISCDATLENIRRVAEARTAVFGGLIEPGGSCFADEECRGEAVCERSACPGAQLCCTGECVEFTIRSVGETCPFPQDGQRLTARCDDSAYCQPPPDDGMGEPPTEGTCVARSDNGMPCDAADACLDGQRCALGGSGSCYKLSAEGEMCNPDLPTGTCLGINDGCSASSSTCVALPGPGEACLQGRCIGYARCGDDGNCFALLRAGEACDGSVPCLGDLECQDNVCQKGSTVLVCVEGEPPPPPEPPM